MAQSAEFYVALWLSQEWQLSSYDWHFLNIISHCLSSSVYCMLGCITTSHDKLLPAWIVIVIDPCVSWHLSLPRLQVTFQVPSQNWTWSLIIMKPPTFHPGRGHRRIGSDEYTHITGTSSASSTPRTASPARMPATGVTHCSTYPGQLNQVGQSMSPPTRSISHQPPQSSSWTASETPGQMPTSGTGTLSWSCFGDGESQCSAFLCVLVPPRGSPLM